MKHPKTPRGWRKLRLREVIRSGDLWSYHTAPISKWNKCGEYDCGEPINELGLGYYIRRIAKKAGGKRK